MRWYHWIITLLLLVLALGLFIGCLVSKPLPEGESGAAADALADRMLEAIGYEQWLEIPYIQWTFRGSHHFLWDKHRHYAEVKWKNYRALIDPTKREGVVYKKGERIADEASEALLDKALQFFYNDSFWLCAPTKVYDPGTMRTLVSRRGEQDALMVTYQSGGLTPGDSYLWEFDEDGKARAWSMWVQILPIKGLKTSWEDWQEFDGALIATNHRFGFLNIRIENLKTGDHYSDFGHEEDPFKILIQP